MPFSLATGMFRQNTRPKPCKRHKREQRHFQIRLSLSLPGLERFSVRHLMKWYPPMDDFSVSVPGGIGTLGYLRILL